MSTDGFTVPTHIAAAMLAPTLAELDSGFDLLHGWMEREAAKTPQQREAEARERAAKRAAEHRVNAARWQAAVDLASGGVRTVLEMHAPSEWASCEGHDDVSWPCAEFEALEGDLRCPHGRPSGGCRECENGIGPTTGDVA